MIPKILHFVVPEKPTREQHALIEQARLLHPLWTLEVWPDNQAIEGGRLSKYLERSAHGAQRADLIRLDVLLLYGGVYLDSDIRVLKPLDQLVAAYDCFLCSEDGVNLSNGAIGTRPGHPAVGAVIGFLEKNEPDWSLPPNITTGPALYSELLRWRDDIQVLPRETFYPCTANEGGTHCQSFGKHLWAGSWIQKPTPSQRRRTLTRNLKYRLKQTVAWPMRQLGTVWTRIKRLANAPGPRTLVIEAPHAYACTEEMVVRTVHGHSLVVDGRDLSISPRIASRGYSAWPEEAFFRRVIRGGDWFIDVGANVGVFSLLAAIRCGPFGRVLAFEPNHHVSGLLKKSAILNWCNDRIKIFEHALSNEAGTTKLTYYPSRLDQARIDGPIRDFDPFMEAERFLSGKQEIEVVASRLDDVLPVNLPIKAMKIDVNGHEARVLEGAKRLITGKAFDYVMLKPADVAGRWLPETIAGFNLLLDHGYAPGWLDADGYLTKTRSLDDALKPGTASTLVFSV